jgi:hypothetical protein
MAERQHRQNPQPDVPGASGDARNQGVDERAMAGKTATSTPVPGGSKSASPDMKETPADNAKPET